MTARAVSVEGLSKLYWIGGRRAPYGTLRDSVAGAWKSVRSTIGKSERQEPVWALKNVTFELDHGEVLGIIGRNGAGKSTLLKILSQVVEPTEGRARVRGRVGCLLEVGTGFHPELSGRENIFLNGAILGMSRADIKRHFDEIVEFAGVGRYLDTAVKFYSSGMYMRLAFAVGAHLEPEVLVIDEALAVGDAEFQARCLRKMRDAGREGRTVLFVSHNLVAIEGLCDRVIVLDSGSLVCDAPAREAISEYLGQGRSVAGSTDLRRSLRSADGLTVVLTSVETQDGSGTQVDSVRCGDPLTVRIRFEHEDRLESPIFGIVFKRADGLVVSHLNSQIMSAERLQSGRCGEAVCRIASLPLLPGEYTISVGVAVGVQTIDLVDDAMTVSVTPADYYGTGRLPQQGTLVLRGEWTSLGTG